MKDLKTGDVHKCADVTQKGASTLSSWVTLACSISCCCSHRAYTCTRVRSRKDVHKKQERGRHAVCKCRNRHDVFIEHSHKGLNERWDANGQEMVWDVLLDLLPLKHLVPNMQSYNRVQGIRILGWKRDHKNENMAGSRGQLTRTRLIPEKLHALADALQALMKQSEGDKGARGWRWRR